MVRGARGAEAGPMTTTPPAPPPPPEEPPPTPGATQVDDGPRVTRDEVRDLARLRRTTGPERAVAGVAGGLGRHLDIDPVILRVAFVVLSFFGGAGLLLYGAAWLLVPDDRATSAPLGLDERSRTVALWIAAGVGAAILLGTSFGDGFVPFPVVVVGGIALLVVLQLNKKKAPPTAGPGQPWAAAQAPGTTYPVDLAKAPSAPGAGPTSTTQTLPLAGWAPPVAPAPMTPVAPAPVWVNPRRRGPILFWFTLALCALAVGTLGVVDAAGASVAASAYPALVLAIVGATLVLGAFWGRAGGLVLVGLLTIPWLLGSLATQSFDGDTTTFTPASAAEVRPSYEFANGEVVLDLRDVADPTALAGRRVEIDGNVGHVEVLVPEGLPVSASATVDGPGGFDLFGNQGGGIGSDGGGSAVSDVDPLVIDAHLTIGFVEVSTRGADR
jgi:phage shock protein PspC (stress-responsive transcriptional regulator)